MRSLARNTRRLPVNISAINDIMRLRDSSWHCGRVRARLAAWAARMVWEPHPCVRAWVHACKLLRCYPPADTQPCCCCRACCWCCRRRVCCCGCLHVRAHACQATGVTFSTLCRKFEGEGVIRLLVEGHCVMVK